MAENCRFAFAIHMLAVLALGPASGSTSEALARSVNTNPVVIRRIVAALLRAGLVKTTKGARGGVRLALSPENISLGQIHRSIDPVQSFGLHRQTPNQRCPVGRHIESVLHEVFSAAQSALEAELESRTLADILHRFREDSDLSESNPGNSISPKAD